MGGVVYGIVLGMSQGLSTAHMRFDFARHAAHHTAAPTAHRQPGHQLRALHMHGVRIADDGGYTIVCPELDMHPKWRTCVLDAPCVVCAGDPCDDVGTWVTRHGQMHVADASGVWCVVDADVCGLVAHARDIDDAWVRQIAATRGAGTYAVNCCLLYTSDAADE